MSDVSGQDDRTEQAPATNSRVRAQRRRLLFIVFGAIAAVATAVWTLRNVPFSSASTDHLTAKSSSALAHKNTAPVISPAAAAQPPSPPTPVPTVAPVIPAELVELKSTTDRQTHQLLEVEQRLSQFEADVAELRAQARERRASFVRPQRSARTSSTAPRASAQEAQPAADPPPTVLSVDTWNGQPSVSVLVDGELRFVSEGDRVGRRLVRQADAQTQRIHFSPISGPVESAAPTVGASQ
jgi:TolA-binding protein